jgi:hypothetical protein
VKNNEDEPKEYFERSILLVIALTAAGLFLDWFSIHLLMEVNPWGTAFAVPGLVLTLQALWLIVNPYAIVYNDRFEIKQSLLYSREFYYLDAKGVEKKNTMNLALIYNDDEREKLPLAGMRASNKELFKNKLAEKIGKSVTGRSF